MHLPPQQSIYIIVTISIHAALDLALLSMPTEDLATLALEMRASYQTALQVRSPASQTMLIMPLLSSVAYKL